MCEAEGVMKFGECFPFGEVLLFRECEGESRSQSFCRFVDRR